MRKIIEKIKFEEGRKYKIYKCTKGYLTIGDGIKMPLTDDEIEKISKSRGYSITNEKIYNDFVLTDDECDILINSRLLDVLGSLNDCEWFTKSPENVRIALVDMCYQMGFVGLSKFKKTIYHIKSKNFGLASEECLRSDWAKQTPNRANRNSKLIKKV